MKRKSCIRLSSITLTMLALVLFLFAGLPVASADENSAESRHPKAETNPLAVVKEGFFFGIDKNRVTLADVDSGRKSQYRIEENYLIFFENEEIPLEHIPPHSIVKLVLIEGQVREIILLLRSS